MQAEKKGDIIMTKKIPKFKSIKNEARFWDTHDVTDYLNELKPVKLDADLKGQKQEVLTIRVQSALKEKMAGLASDYGINLSLLARMWLIDKLKEARKNYE